jgi:hypothetical protein
MSVSGFGEFRLDALNECLWLSPAFIEDTCERLSANGRILRGGG